MIRNCFKLFQGRVPWRNNINVLEQHVRSLSYDVPGYKWEYMTAKTFPAAIKLMTEYFCDNELATKAIGLAKNPKAVEEFSYYCADTALDGISVVIIDTESNEVIGTGFNKLHSAPDRLGQQKKVKYNWTQPESKHFAIDFVSQITDKVDLFQKYGVETTMELSMWSVHPDHRNKKIGYILGQFSVDTAEQLQNGPVSKFTVEDLGPSFAAVQERDITQKAPQLFFSLLTSSKTQTVAKKFGCVSEAQISFNDVYYNGKSYSELLGAHDEFYVDVITYLLCDKLKKKHQISR